MDNLDHHPSLPPVAVSSFFVHFNFVRKKRKKKISKLALAADLVPSNPKNKKQYSFIQTKAKFLPTK